MKININYVLEPAFEEQCVEINQTICHTAADNEIDFCLDKTRPHITLLMGEIDEKDFPKISKMIKNLKFCATTEKIEFESPKIASRYVIYDVKNIQPFKKDCDMLLHKLGNLITPHKYLISNGTTKPHITVGYADTKNLPKDFLGTLPALNSTQVHKVVVSMAGKHGVVKNEKENSNLEAKIQHNHKTL